MKFRITIDGFDADEIEAEDQEDADRKCFNAARNHFLTWDQVLVIEAHPRFTPDPLATVFRPHEAEEEAGGHLGEMLKARMGE